MLVGVKVSEWARISGVSRQSADRWLHAGVLAVLHGSLRPARSWSMRQAGQLLVS